MTRKHLDQSTKDLEKQLLSEGLHFRDVSNRLGVSYSGLVHRNKTVYKIDCVKAFKKRILQNGLPNRLQINDAFGYWFSGWFDGEGHFGLQSFCRKNGQITQSLFIQVKIRDDDFSVIDRVMKHLGVGCIFRGRSNGKKAFSNPTITFKVGDVADLVEVIIPLFDKYALYTKKSKEFVIWKQAVIERYTSTLGGIAKYRNQSCDLSYYEEEIKSIRSYSK